jgi:hypothetical protein
MWTIKSLDVAGNRIEIDNHCGNVGNAGRGYYGTNEATYLAWLTPFLYPMPATAATHADSVGASGTDAAPRLISGGWNASDVIAGVTVISLRNGLGDFFNNKQSVKITGGMVFVRANRGLYDNGGINWLYLRHFFVVSSSSASIYMSFSTLAYFSVRKFQYVWDFNSGDTGNVGCHCYIACLFRDSFSLKSFGNLYSSTQAPAINFNGCDGTISDVCAYNGVGYGISNGSDSLRLVNARIYFITVAALAAYQAGRERIKNLLTDSSIIAAGPATTYAYGDGIIIQGFGGVIGDNRVYYPSMGQATYNATTLIWTIAVNNVNATPLIPMCHEVGEIYCDTAGVPYAISLTVNPSNAALVAQLKIRANTIAGVGFDTYAQSSGAGAQVLTVTITPLEAGWVKIYLDCYITNPTLTHTLTYDLDDLAATQNAVAMRIRGIGTELFGEERVGAELGADLLAWEAARNISAGAVNILSGVVEKIRNVDIIGSLSLVTISNITPSGSATAGGATASLVVSNAGATAGTVEFGSAALGWTAATILSWSATQITVRIPALGASIMGVRITTALAQVSTLDNCFTVYGTPSTSVKQRIVEDGIKYGLLQITQNNGYNSTMRAVYDPPSEIDSMTDFPSCILEVGNETCENANTGSHLQTGGNQALLHNQFDFIIHMVLSDANAHALAREKALADVKKYFGTHWNLPNSYGEATAFNCFYVGSDPWGVNAQKLLTGISITFRVWYRHYLSDPAISG